MAYVSDKEIPKIVSDVLSLGNSFGLPIDLADKKDRMDSVLEMVMNVKLCTNKIPQCSIEKSRITVANSVINGCPNQNTSRPSTNIYLKVFLCARSS